MKKKDCFWLIMAVVMTFSTAYSQQQAVKMEGKWLHKADPNDEYGHLVYMVDFRQPDSIVLDVSSGYGVGAYYEGTYQLIEGDRYAFDVHSVYGPEEVQACRIKGSFNASIDSENYLNFKLNDQLGVLDILGQNVLFFHEGLPYTVAFDGDNPTVLDLYKMIYPFSVRNEYESEFQCVVNNVCNDLSSKEEVQEKIVDVEHNFISFSTNLPLPMSSSYRLYECRKRGKYLFVYCDAYNESLYPTAPSVHCYLYDHKARTIQSVLPPYHLSRDARYTAIKLSRTTPDLEVIYLDDYYSPSQEFQWLNVGESVFRWNGRNFEEDVIEPIHSKMDIIRSFIPDGFEEVTRYSADLNADGIEDCIWVVRKIETGVTQYGVIPLMAVGDQYKAVDQHLSVFRMKDSPVYTVNDPYCFITVKRGCIRIYVSHGADSDDAYLYRYQDGSFKLIGHDARVIVKDTPVEIVSTNFLTGQQIRRFKVNEDSDAEPVYFEERNVIQVARLEEMSAINNLAKQ